MAVAHWADTQGQPLFTARSLVFGPGPNRLAITHIRRLSGTRNGHVIIRLARQAVLSMSIPRGFLGSALLRQRCWSARVAWMGSSLSGEVLPGAQWRTGALRARLQSSIAQLLPLHLGRLEKEAQSAQSGGGTEAGHTAACCCTSAGWRRRCRALSLEEARRLERTAHQGFNVQDIHPAVPAAIAPEGMCPYNISTPDAGCSDCPWEAVPSNCRAQLISPGASLRQGLALFLLRIRRHNEQDGSPAD